MQGLVERGKCWVGGLPCCSQVLPASGSPVLWSVSPMFIPGPPLPPDDGVRRWGRWRSWGERLHLRDQLVPCSGPRQVPPPHHGAARARTGHLGGRVVPRAWASGLRARRSRFIVCEPSPVGGVSVTAARMDDARSHYWKWGAAVTHV